MLYGSGCCLCECLLVLLLLVVVIVGGRGNGVDFGRCVVFESRER